MVVTQIISRKRVPTERRRKRSRNDTFSNYRTDAGYIWISYSVIKQYIVMLHVLQATATIKMFLCNFLKYTKT